jgi:serine protease Do
VVGLLAFGCAPLSTGGSAPANGGRITMTSFAPLVQAVIPAVVNVSAVQKTGKAAAADGDAADGASAVRDRPSLDELLRKFLDQQDRKDLPTRPGLALGSGFVVDPSGYIVTDDHVLENADAVTVTFRDGAQLRAKIIGRDPLTDLALLKIDAQHPLPYVRWGDSDAARVGDWVLAIGNPFGLDDTVSSGIISARGRDIHSGPYDDFLQIDASINRGNSGGPTFDLDGRVIGINSAIYSPNGGSVGIGFAIPANLARPVVEQLRQHGKVERGWLGVQIQPVTADIAQGFGLAKPGGALVAGISPGGPAAHAGFAEGDVILSVNGQDISTMRDLPLIVAEMPIGDAANVVVWRQNKELRLQPVIGQMPETGQMADLGQDQATPPEKSGDIASGLKLAVLTAQMRHRLRVPANVAGVVVTAIGNGSALAGLDLLPGDVIEMIGQRPVASPEDALTELRAAAGNARTTVLVLINRHGTNRYLALSLAGNSSG